MMCDTSKQTRIDWIDHKIDSMILGGFVSVDDIEKLAADIRKIGATHAVFPGVTYPQPERHVGFDYDSDVLFKALGYKIQ